jgi:hypothetical protein
LRFQWKYPRNCYICTSQRMDCSRQWWLSTWKTCRFKSRPEFRRRPPKSLGWFVNRAKLSGSMNSIIQTWSQ